MLYNIAHFLKNRCPWIWNMIDILNSFLFSLRYGSKLRKINNELVAKELYLGYNVIPIHAIPTNVLVDFFAHQPDEAYIFFKPHGFDTKSIKKLQRNKAFLAYILMDKGIIVGYCFNRSFFHGKGFRGRMVDINYRGKGLGTVMNHLLNDIGFGIGLRLFETVNKDNVASLRSAKSASRVRVIKEMQNNDLYLEILEN